MIRAVLRAILPQSARIQVRRIMVRLTLPSASPRALGTHGRSVTVIGYLSSPTGLGEGARLAVAALSHLGFRVGLIDITQLLRLTGGVRLPTDLPGVVEGDIGGPLICHINPPDFQTVLLLQRLSGKQRPLYAHWVWELPVVPPVWQQAFRLPHEVWVPSEFVADSLRNSGFRGIVRMVAYPLLEAAAPARPDSPGNDKFTVLIVFAYDSGFDRKNPIGGVAAFRRAFGDRTDVRLVIKVRGESPSGEAERRLGAAIGEAANIVLIDQQYDHEQMLALMLRADVLLSLHRAEGFGLPLAQAMLSGKPVVATAWSGNLAFMSEDSACLVPTKLVPVRDETAAYQGIEANWADADIDVAADWLARLAADPSLRDRVGEAARRFASERLGRDAYGAAIAPALGMPAVSA